MANKCSLIRKNKNTTYPNIAKWIGKYLLDNNASSIDNPNGVNRTNLLMMLKQQLIARGDKDLAEIIHEVIQTEFDADISIPYIRMAKKNALLPTGQNVLSVAGELGALQFSSYTDSLLDTGNSGNADNQTDSTESLTSDDFVNQTETGGVKIGKDILDVFNELFSHVTKKNHSPEEMAIMFKKIKTMNNVQEFIQFLDRTYDLLTGDESGQGLREDLEIIRNIIQFYNAHTEINEMKREDLKEYSFINIDPSVELDDVKQDLKKGIVKRLRFIRSLPINLKQKTQLSIWVAKNFIQASTAKIRGIDIGLTTAYFDLNKIGRVKGRKDGGWWFNPTNLDVNEYQLNQWILELGNFVRPDGRPAPLILVSPTPGDTGTFFMTHILGAQVNELFPKEALFDLLMDAGLEVAANEIVNIPDGFSVLGWFKDAYHAYQKEYYEYTTVTKEERDKNGANAKSIAYLKYGDKTQERFAAIQARWNAIEKMFREVGMQNLITYLDAQVKAGNMTEPQAKTIIQTAMKRSQESLNTQNERLPFVTYLSSIITKHEWLQAVRGNDYMTHKDGNVYHLITRLKINKSKGLVYEDQGGTTSLIYDQDKVVFYKVDPVTGEETKIENISEVTGINIDDGATFQSTQKMDQRNSAAGIVPIEGKANEFDSRTHKTVRSQLVTHPDGTTSYIEYKHAVFEAPDNIIIKAKNGKVILRTVRTEYGVEIFDGDGNRIDDFADLDAVKTNSGQYDLDKRGTSHLVLRDDLALKEESERYIISPHIVGNNTTYGPMQYLSSLNYNLDAMDDLTRQQFQEYVDAFVELMLDQANIFNDAMIDSHMDPRVMRAIIKHIYSRRTEQKSTLKDGLEATGGKGIHHDNFMIPLMPMLTNMLLGKGMLQSRSSDKKIAGDKGNVGTNLILRPDTKREVDRDAVILPAGDGNSVIFDATVKKILPSLLKIEPVAELILRVLQNLESQGRIKIPESLAASPLTWLNNNLDSRGAKEVFKNEEVLQAINDYLQVNPTFVMSYRSPILDMTSIESRRVQEFRPGMANQVIHHPDDVTIRLIGDFDIDEAGVMILSDKAQKAFAKFYQTDFYKQQKKDASALEYMATVEDTTGQVPNLADEQSVIQSWISIIKGIGLQGMATNMRAVTFTLSMHFNSITLSTPDHSNKYKDPANYDKDARIENTVVRPKKPTDMVVMDYAPLKVGNDGKPLLQLEDLPPGASIEFINGNYYLKTTAAHEMLLIVNAATDHANKKIMGMMVNTWGLKNKDWFINRMFHIDKSPHQDANGNYYLDAEQCKCLRKLANKFNYSSIKSLRTYKTKRRMSMNEFVFFTGEILKMLNKDISELALEIQRETRIEKRLKDGTGSETLLEISHIDPITEDNHLKMTPEEKLITSFVSRVEERSIPEDEMSGAPYHYEQKRKKVAKKRKK